MKLFVTTSSYALGKQLGVEAANAELRAQVQDPSSESLPCVRTIARLRELSELELRIDTGGTVIGKVRSRHFRDACVANADVWLSVDDDVEATLATLDALLGAVASHSSFVEPRVCVAPYVIRGSTRIDVETLRVEVKRDFPSFSGRYPPGESIRVKSAGFGLVAMNRAAMREMQLYGHHLTFIDDDSEVKEAVFQDVITTDGRWLGEDRSFFYRLPPQVSIEALIVGTTAHDGVALDLQRVR